MADFRSRPDRPAETQSGLRSSPWVALGVVLVGSYAAALNVTVVGVAMPAIAADLDAGHGRPEVDWVVTSYLIGVVLTQPATAWLADRWGRASIYGFSLAVFGVGAMISASAPDMVVLIAGRAVQGLGGGALIPVGMALVYELFPPDRRGTALGVWGVGIAGAPAAGPPLGGWLVTAAGWRWLFAVFAVIAVVAVALSVTVLRDSGFRERRRFDRTGWLLAAGGITTVVVISRQIGTSGVSVPTLAIALGAIAMLVMLVRRSLRRTEPIIDFRLFRTSAFSITVGASAALGFAQFARLNYLPVELQVVREMEASEVGLLLTPAAIGIALMMPIGGWLADRIGARLPVLIGASAVAWAMWELGHLRADDSQFHILVILVVQGAGTGLTFVPTTVAAMNSLPSRHVAQSSTITNLTRQFAGAIGIAVLGALLVADLGAVAPTGIAADEAQAAYNSVFVVAFWFAVIAAVAAVFVPGRRATAAHQAARVEEHAALVS